MSAPLVSVVIPYFNQGAWLQTSVQSALAAYAGPLEVLIVDDGSTEPGRETFLRNAAALSDQVRIIRKANGGLSSARNAGLAEARGDFVQFLDCDDALVPGKIDQQVAHLASRPDLVASISHYASADPGMTEFGLDHDSIGPYRLSIDSFLMHWERGFSVPIHTALFRAEALATPTFDEALAGKEDWVFWCELLRRHPRGLGYLPVLGAIYRLHGRGMTRAYARMGQAFRAAAARIETLWGQDHPAFAPAAQRWFERYYAPRIVAETDRPAQADRAAAVDAPAAVAALTVFPAVPDRPAPDGRLSIVIPVYNHLEHLAGCIASALAQPEAHEVIALDDASTDPRVWPFLEAWAAREPRLKVFRNAENLGVSETQNRAVKAASGEFVGFLDCDDELEPGAAARVLWALDAEGPDYLFTDRTDIDPQGSEVRVARYGGYPWLAPSGSIERDLYLGMVASHWKVIRRSTYLEAGGCDPAFSGVQDWELALRLIGRARFTHLSEPLYRHRVHAGSVTSGQQTAQMWLTNLARRRHVEAIAPKAGARSVVHRLDDHAAARRLLDRRLAGETLAFDGGRDPLAADQIHLLREFNSLFDEMRLEETSQAALMGYLWSHRIIG
ncbi:glycosyltransferase family 2 protein [Brevundimonas sp. 2R-24]|uniref:Glycosyltransferase family 2 protein n=1 Tax=Peiella sedimenti TaxID=3061083 RepID=A0ABT8SKC7_9CAUL|nr:glycosyltransferase family 2 protein [Caulobacteraceae bacterium XZ-24]